MFVIIALYSVMVLVMIDQFPIKEDSFRFIYNVIVNVFRPIKHVLLPFKWWSRDDQKKTELIKRVAKGIAVTVPCLFILIVMLSSADLVFLEGTKNFFNNIWHLLDSEMVYKLIYGIAIGLYLFGFMYIAYNPEDGAQTHETKASTKDLAILNALLISVLVVYTLFVFIQFRYLLPGPSSLWIELRRICPERV